MNNIEDLITITIAFILGYSAATFCSSEPLDTVSQYEVATPIYSH